MQTLKTTQTLQAFIAKQKNSNKTVALVSTMGGVHGGHLALVKAAKKQADVVIVSIFVNPAQFGENEDLATYPRTLTQDKRLLADVEADILWLPQKKDLYPLPENFTITAPDIANQYCGKSRPVFFHGISLVVLKLLNIVRPDYAYFGQKDYQQLHIIKLLVQDFFMPTQIIDIATVREADGLAMSTRNQYLDKKQRQIAIKLYQTLQWAKNQIIKQNDLEQVKASAIQRLTHYFKVDYFEIVDSKTLVPITKTQKPGIEIFKRCPYIRILTAVYLGKIRLIDNLEV